MSAAPDVPSEEELSALPAAELAALLAEAYRLVGELTARNEELATRIGRLERQAGRDSSTSSRPPSSDSPYRKKGKDRSLRERGKRRPGKQPGEPGSTMRLIDDPSEVIDCPPAACRGCGSDLAGAPVTAQRRHQVTDIEPAPAPRTTEYRAQAKECGYCGETTAGELPAGVRARASYGPEVAAQAANLVSGHYIPVHRATLLLCELAGIAVSTGWMAGIRGRAAGLVESSGFMDRIRELLRSAPAVHADETPVHAAGGTRYLHLACTRYLSCLHAGSRSADDIDAGGVLPGYAGIIVRDGYAGYAHLTSALHAWCGAHLLRDLKGLYDFEPAKQEWAARMASLLVEARDAAAAARAAGQDTLGAAVLDDLVTRYRGLAASGLTANFYRRTATARDARRLARRFRNCEDLILRFATRPDLDIFTNNEAERTIRPAKVQQRSSGGCWRTIQGLADFALVQSYLSTADKWGVGKLDALRGLFTGQAWLPPGLEPA
ncbi:MAG: IS66 family transposase [Streptosporangiaceae bacterium]